MDAIEVDESPVRVLGHVLVTGVQLSMSCRGDDFHGGEGLSCGEFTSAVHTVPATEAARCGSPRVKKAGASTNHLGPGSRLYRF